jgi:hypothetical protein
LFGETPNKLTHLDSPNATTVASRAELVDWFQVQERTTESGPKSKIAADPIREVFRESFLDRFLGLKIY